MNFQNFQNLPRIKQLPIYEQHRQFFIHRGNQMYERSFINSTVASSSSAGGSHRQTIFNGLGISGSFSQIEFLKLVASQNNPTAYITDTQVSFTGITVMDKNTDDGYQYFISRDTVNNQMVFGKFSDINNLIVIDNENLTGLSINDPSSLYYDGNGSFIYMDGNTMVSAPSPPSTINVIRINIDGTCEFIIENLDISSGIYPSVLFPYNETVWGAYLYSGISSSVGEFNIETGEFTNTSEISLIGVPDLQSWKIWLVLGTTTYNGQIYLSMYINNKDLGTYIECITTFNPETSEATFVSFIDITQYIVMDITTL